MSLAPKRDDYTFEEWQEMDNNEKIELIDGTLYMISEPSRRHQKVSTNLIVELGSFLKGKKCELYHSPFMYLYTSRRGVKMNLNDFETYIDDTILMRGLDYYKSGNVFSLEFDGKKWIADVSGSDNYTVTVTLSDDGEILDTDCDCPYDWGEYCKHQAAVLFELREELQSGEKPVKSVKKDSLEALLENLDKQTLISMLKEFAGRDKAMRQEIFLRFAKKNDDIESARDVIRSSIDEVNYRGFVEYRDVSRAMRGTDTVLQMIDDDMDANDIMTTVSLCIVVLEEMMDLMAHCDDSDGYVGGAVKEAMEKINEAISAMPPNHEESEEIFDVIFDHMQDSIYEGWSNFQIDLMEAVIPLCENQNNRNKLEQYITAHSDLHDDYDKNKWQAVQYEIIKQFDGEDAATEYMEQHVNNSDFRLKLIQNAMSNKLYDKALELCLDGECKDSKYAGLVNKWKKFRYEIYEKTANIEGQKTLGLELLLNDDFEYFLKLKALYKDDEWYAYLKEILDKLKDDRNGIYVKILIHEKLKLPLLEYCKKRTDTIVSYYSYLLPEYNNDVNEIFIKYISDRAAHANDRSNYRDVCGLIKHYKKACGDKAAHDICVELSRKYSKRPAFLDELRKI